MIIPNAAGKIKRARKLLRAGVDDWGESVYNGGVRLGDHTAQTRALRGAPLRILIQIGGDLAGGASPSPTDSLSESQKTELVKEHPSRCMRLRKSCRSSREN